MDAVTLDTVQFRARFPAFVDEVLYPAAMLERQFEAACMHVSPHGGKRLAGSSRMFAVELMTAHLTQLESALLRGDTSGLVSAATVDKVSVTLSPPPVKTQREHWLCLTPYGQQLLALFKSKAAVPLFVSGTPAEREAFRKAGGVFTKQMVNNG